MKFTEFERKFLFNKLKNVEEMGIDFSIDHIGGQGRIGLSAEDVLFLLEKGETTFWAKQSGVSSDIMEKYLEFCEGGCLCTYWLPRKQRPCENPARFNHHISGQFEAGIKSLIDYGGIFCTTHAKIMEKE